MKILLLIVTMLVLIFCARIAYEELKSYEDFTFTQSTKTQSIKNNGNDTWDGAIIVWDGDVSWYRHSPTQKTAVFKKNGDKQWFVNGVQVPEHEF